MDKQLESLKNLLLTDPITLEKLYICSPIKDTGNGSYSFEVTNISNSVKWRHTIKTEEI